MILPIITGMCTIVGLIGNGNTLNKIELSRWMTIILAKKIATGAMLERLFIESFLYSFYNNFQIG